MKSLKFKTDGNETSAIYDVGCISGSITACRTFVTQGTLLAERTASISHLSLSQALGFVLGPGKILQLLSSLESQLHAFRIQLNSTTTTTMIFSDGTN